MAWKLTCNEIACHHTAGTCIKDVSSLTTLTSVTDYCASLLASVGEIIHFCRQEIHVVTYLFHPYCMQRCMCYS